MNETHEESTGTSAEEGEIPALPDDFGLSVVIPVYNERDGIAQVLEGISAALAKIAAPSEIIVVDDGSTDGTRDVLESLMGVRIIRHKRNAGYGAALKTGIRKSRFDWICITDGDGTYPSERIPDLVAHAADSDMVVGARTAKGAKVPLVRRPAKWVLFRLAGYLTKTPIPDLNSGLRIMRKAVVERFIRLLPDGFSFTSTITLAMLTNSYAVTYVPIDYATRVGSSKIRPIYDTLNFLQLIIRMVLYFNPLRVFLPLSMLFFALGFASLTYRMLIGSALGVTTIVVFLSAFQTLAIGLLADLIDKRVR